MHGTSFCSPTLYSLLFFGNKKRGSPEKVKDFPLCRTLEILGKYGKNAQKSKENRKTKNARKAKKQGLEGQEFGFGKRGLLERVSFQKNPFSRNSREFRDSRDFRL